MTRSKSFISLLLALSLSSCLFGAEKTTTGTNSGISGVIGAVSSNAANDTDALAGGTAPDAGTVAETDSIAPAIQPASNSDGGYGTVINIPRPQMLTNTIVFRTVKTEQSSGTVVTASVEPDSISVPSVSDSESAPDVDASLPSDQAEVTAALATPSGETEAVPTLLENSETALPGLEYCETSEQFPMTRICELTPSRYTLGVLKINIVTCVASDGKVGPCHNQEAQVTESQILYAGGVVNMTASAEGMEFPKPLRPLAADINASGLRLMLSYVEQTFPDVNGVPEEAAKVHPELQGKAYRRCLTSEEERSPEEMLSYCGHEDAKFGDILVDLNDDGVFGYLDLPPELGGFEESPDRLSVYTEPVYRKYFKELKGFYDFVMDGAFLQNGFLSVAFNFPTPEAIKADSTYAFYVDFNIDGTLRFADGARAHPNRTENICAEFWFDAECENGDDDPHTIGVYDPTYDFFAFSFRPETVIHVEERSSDGSFVEKPLGAKPQDFKEFEKSSGAPPSNKIIIGIPFGETGNASMPPPKKDSKLPPRDSSEPASGSGATGSSQTSAASAPIQETSGTEVTSPPPDTKPPAGTALPKDGQPPPEGSAPPPKDGPPPPKGSTPPPKGGPPPPK